MCLPCGPQARAREEGAAPAGVLRLLEVTWEAAWHITDGGQASGAAGGQRGGRVHRGGCHRTQV